MPKIALAQINPTVGDIKGNEKKIISFIQDAKKRNVDLIIFPELAITGYPPEDLLFKNDFVSEAMASLTRIASFSTSLSIIVGVPVFDGGKLYNSASICQGGAVKEQLFKSHLPNYSVFDEARYFASGKNNFPIEIAGVTVAVTICEDIWIKEGLPADASGDESVEFVINISSSPFCLGKSEQRSEIVKGWAKRFNKPVLYCNLVGGQDELVFDGGSFVADRDGNVIASALQFKEELLIIDLFAEENKSINLPQAVSYPENVFKALTLGVKDYVEKNGFNEVLIALSGGIDSAIVASIAVEALSASRVFGVALPSKYSSVSSMEDARELANNHGIKLQIIPITGLMDGFDESLEHAFWGTDAGLAEENIQARIRGTIMMALSNKFSKLVLTTGNKSEIAVGYCTLYGDMAGGFAVIKDLPKTMVYELAKWVNETGRLPKIPLATITKPPSAELREGQRDSDSLPEYNELDPILKMYVEEDKSLEEIVDCGYNPADVKRVTALVDKNEYKRRQTAPGVKISPRAFGKDRRMPITNGFKPV